MTQKIDSVEVVTLKNHELTIKLTQEKLDDARTIINNLEQEITSLHEDVKARDIHIDGQDNNLYVLKGDVDSLRETVAFNNKHIDMQDMKIRSKDKQIQELKRCTSSSNISAKSIRRAINDAISVKHNINSILDCLDHNDDGC